MDWQGAVERRVVDALTRAPRRLQHRIGGRRINADGDVLEPEMAAALRLLEAAPGADLPDLPLEQARAQLTHEADLFAGEQLRMAEVRDLHIPAAHGVIPARRYLADPGDTDRLLVYFHGGGWVLGDLEVSDSTCRFLARHAGVSVLSVDYRLAPEHPFPAAVEDARTAFDYAVNMAADWGHDPHRIAVGGDSAGANLAAVLSLETRREAGVGAAAPAFQLLIVPCVDLVTKRDSYREFATGHFLTERHMDWYRDLYLGGADAAEPRVSPLLADDLSGLPPAYVATAGFDVLRDEGAAYAAALSAAGVPVALRRHGGLIHPFAQSTGVSVAGAMAMAEASGALRMALR